MKKLIFCLSAAFVSMGAAAQEVQPSDSATVREQIDSVTVSARRKAINLRSDRLVVSLDGIEKDGKNAADMLKLAPSLTVSNSGISMARRDKVLVYIDNRQLSYSGAELGSISVRHVRPIPKSASACDVIQISRPYSSGVIYSGRKTIPFSCLKSLECRT